MFEATTAALPLVADSTNQVFEPVPVRTALGPKLRAIVDAQEGMPVQSYNPTIEPARIQAPIRQDNHRPLWGHGRAQQAQQAQPFLAPCAFGASRQDRPGHRNPTPAVDHAHGQNHKSIPQARGIQGQGQLRAHPQADDPLQQRQLAGAEDQFLPLLPALVFGIQAPFIQPLLHRGHFLSAQQTEKGCHRVAPTTARHRDPKTPPRQHPGLTY